MSALFSPTPISDLYVYRPKVFSDPRGAFYESFNASHFAEMGIPSTFVQDNQSISIKGTLRGLHLQVGEFAQAKFVSVLRGHVYDVAVDLRPTSSTFKKWYGIHLKAEEPTSLYIPRGFAHGFVVLSESAHFFYKVDNFYDKSSERSIAFDDPDLNIVWPLAKEQLTLSDKDKAAGSLQMWCKEFT